jgi:membrane-associated phospholipid phosphatase
LAIVGKVIDPQTPAFTTANLDAFQPSQINPRWDRAATRNYSLRAQHRSDVLLKAALAVPLTLALSSRCRQVRQGGVVLGMGAEAALLTYGLTNTLKNTVRRPRPLAYNPAFPLDTRLHPDARKSFPSGHTSMSTVACVFTAQVFSDLYPRSRWRPVVWAGALAVPATVGYFRFQGGKHFPTDVLAGMALGTLVGWGVPRLHRMRQ